MSKRKRNIAGTLSGLGVGSTALFPASRTIQDLMNLKEFQSPTFSREHFSKQYSPMPGDIIISSGIEDLRDDSSFGRVRQALGHGRKDLAHTSIVMPVNPEVPTRNLRVVGIGAINSSKNVAPYRTVSKISRAVGGGDLKRALRLLIGGGHASKNNAELALNGKLLTRKKLMASLENLVAEPKHLGQERGIVHIYRPNKPLSPEEIIRAHENLRKTLPFLATDESQAISGLKNFFLPLMDKTHKLKIPGSCAGSACNVFSGIRRTLDPSTAIPSDLPLMKDFSKVLSHYHVRRKIPAGALGNLKMARKAIGVKGALALALLGAGAGTKAIIDKLTD